MGYKVTLSVSSDTERLCRLLSEQPETLFDKPFFGYVVFLLTGREKKLIATLSQDLGELDSLSRDVFAYVIAAEECSLSIDAVEWEKEAYDSNHASKAALPVQTYHTDLAYIKLHGISAYSEIFNKSARGELIALSNAANRVAKWFGVIPQLPCMLIFDPQPQSSPAVVPIDDALVTNIIAIFRNVVGKISGPSYRQHIDTIQKIGEIDAKLDRREPREPSLEAIRASQSRRLNDYADAVARVDRALRKGATAGDTQQCLFAAEKFLELRVKKRTNLRAKHTA
jgi:hypothetical protein